MFAACDGLVPTSVEATMQAMRFTPSCALRLTRRLCGLVAAASLVFSSGGAHAQPPPQAPAPQIVVTGDGSVGVAPNYAQIRCGATTRSKRANEAVDANSRLMAAIMAALKAAGIVEKDIQTARFSIQPIYARAASGISAPDAEPQLAGYSVSNQVNVVVREVGKVGDVLDRIVAAGATDVGNVSFLVGDASKALDQAREAAIADARRKAEVYAKASDVRLGRVQWITEETGGGPPVMPMARAVAASVPIATGEDTLRVRVTVGFEIAR
jgi:uncharacterized protein YggE